MSIMSLLIGIAALLLFFCGMTITGFAKTNFDGNLIMIATAIFLVAAAICFK